MSEMSKSSLHRICKNENIQGRSRPDWRLQCPTSQQKPGPKLKLNAGDLRMLLKTLYDAQDPTSHNSYVT